ncbi:MAG: hypothetical protein JWN74_1339 [Acidobacteriaceae bacterium]|nr:hypothetical protein [Acidobacteriaceae bacterium]
MKRFMLVSPILLLLISVSAFADSVTIILAPGSPEGGNFEFISHQQGISVFLVGTVPESFYSGSLIAPGSTLGGASNVFVDGGLIKINGVSYDNLGLDIGSLFIGSFTFPTNGKDFTIPVHASFSVDEEIVGTGITIHINQTVSGRVKFYFISNVGLYVPSRMVLTTVPEPATLGLMGTGLAGILAFARKKLKGIHTI